jgi:hypothetical protein
MKDRKRKARRVEQKSAEQQPLNQYPGTLMMIPVDLIVIDPKYQRGTTTKLKRIAENFSWYCFRPVLAEKLKSSKYVKLTDGQQSYLAAVENGMTHVPGTVLPSQGTPKEAEHFGETNRNQTGLGSYDEYRAALTARNPVALRVAEILKMYDYRIENSKADGCLQCPRTLMKLFEDDDSFATLLCGLLFSVYNGATINNRIFKAFALIIQENTPFDWDAVEARLKILGGGKMIDAAAHEGISSYVNFTVSSKAAAYGIVQKYNGRLRTSCKKLRFPDINKG